MKIMMFKSCTVYSHIFYFEMVTFEDESMLSLSDMPSELSEDSGWNLNEEPRSLRPTPHPLINNTEQRSSGSTYILLQGVV